MILWINYLQNFFSIDEVCCKGMIWVVLYVKKNWDNRVCLSLLWDCIIVMVTNGGLVRVVIDLTKVFGCILFVVAEMIMRFIQRSVWSLFFFGIFWSIWNAHNNLIFIKVETNCDGIYYSLFHRITTWAKYSNEPFLYTRIDILRSQNDILMQTNKARVHSESSWISST